MDYDRPLPEDEAVIPPDVAPRRELPLDPADALQREREKYGENSTNPNRDDQFDEHHGTADDIV
jgi:hypothetical protein